MLRPDADESRAIHETAREYTRRTVNDLRDLCGMTLAGLKLAGAIKAPHADTTLGAAA